MSNPLGYIKFLNKKRDIALEEGDHDKVIEIAVLIEEIFTQYKI